MKRIITMCRQGLCRSVGLADVLKLHFEPVDVLPIGYFGNSLETRRMLMEWADHIIVMEAKYMQHVYDDLKHKAHICEVGPDTYGHSHNPQLIDKCWRWCRQNAKLLGIKEHNKKL